MSLFDFDPRETAVDELHQATAIYTSGHVVEKLLDRVGWPTPGASLLDPSAGDGAFLIRALSRLAPTPGDRETALRVRGCEIHPLAVREARANVAEYLGKLGWNAAEAAEVATEMVLERDFLIDGIQGFSPKFCLGNPPYLRYARLPAFFQQLYAGTLERHALADVLHAFLDRCSSIMPDDGVIGLVTADRWLFNESAGALREMIGRRVGLDFVGRLDTTTSFYRAKTRRAGSLPRVHPVEVVMRPAALAASAITSAPISPDGIDLTEQAVGPTLGDVASVRIAPWLGPHGVFVVNEAAASGMDRSQLVPAVDTDDIDPHTDVLHAPKRLAIRTERGVEPSGAIRAHLLAAHQRMPERGRSGDYWIPPEMIRLRLDKPSLLVPRIARRMRAIELPAGVLPINHNLSVVTANDQVSLSQLKAWLCSESSQKWLERHAPRLENGFYSITTKLLRRLPMPAEMALELAHLIPEAAAEPLALAA